MKVLQKNKLYLRLKPIVVKHKVLSSIILVIIILVINLGYGKITSTGGQPQYVLSTVQKGTVVASVSGSGQVSVFNQIDIKPKVSGEIKWIGVKAGEEVKRGLAIALIDNTDAKKAVDDARLNLDEANLNLDKATAQAPIDYERKLESLKKAQDALITENKNIFSTVSKLFIDLPTIVTGTESVLYGTNMDASSGQWNVNAYRDLFDEKDQELVQDLADIAEKNYKIARTAYDKSFLNYKNIVVNSGNLILENMLSESLETAEDVAQSAKSEINLLDTVVDITNIKGRKINPVITNFQSNLKTYLVTANSHTSALSSQINAITTAKENILNINRDLSVLRINNPLGTKPIDLQISENSIKKQEVVLTDLVNKLNDYVIRAPFDGVIAKLPLKVADSASSGTSIATLVTKQKLAEISLNEIDAAKVKIGQKATLAFDAVEDLTITGEVVEIDTIGTVTQGVVNYAVKINFDTQDARIKSGMSTSVAIITDVKPDVLTVPNGAIKSQGSDGSYVEMLNTKVSSISPGQSVPSPTAPTKHPVQTGLTNDALTEIISGLKEGDQVITRTITIAVSSATQAPSILSAVGGRATTGGATRALGR